MDLGILYFFYDIYVSKYLLGPQSGILIEVIRKSYLDIDVSVIFWVKN
jgi:hypothetical protein